MYQAFQLLVGDQITIYNTYPQFQRSCIFLPTIKETTSRETHNLGADIGTYLSGNISEIPRFQMQNNS